MAGTHSVVLIFGAGANVGLSVARKFKDNGYAVAAVSRTVKDELKEVAHKTIACSITPQEVPKIFAEVEKELGIPSVIIYNGTQTGSFQVPFRMKLTHDSKFTCNHQRRRPADPTR